MEAEEKKVKKCSNCKEEWKDGHKCNDSLQLGVKDDAKVESKFG